MGKLALAPQQIAFEVIRIAGDDASLVEDLEGPAPQVIGFRIGLRFAIDDAPHQQLRARAFAQERVRRPPQRVVGSAELVTAAVPRAYRLAWLVLLSRY